MTGVLIVSLCVVAATPFIISRIRAERECTLAAAEQHRAAAERYREEAESIRRDERRKAEKAERGFD